MPIDQDDLPGYLRDAYAGALEHGLLQLNLTRIGAEGTRQWQCSSRFPRSAGYHVEIAADPFDAIMGALGAWRRVEGTAPAPQPQEEPVSEGLFD